MSQSYDNFWNDIKNNSKHVSWENEKALQQTDGKLTVRNVLEKLQMLSEEIVWLQATLDPESDRAVPPSITRVLTDCLDERKALQGRLEKLLDDTVVELPD